MLNIKSLCYVLLFLLLTACSANTVKDETSEFYAIPVGSLLELNEDVTINGDQVATYVQNGKLMSYDDVDKYQPNCKFEIYTMSEKPRSVFADTFEIVKVEDDIESSALKNNTQLAALDNTVSRRGMYGSLDRSQVFNYATLLYLNSDKQKDVYRMTCQHWEDVMDDRHLSISQMRSAMGDVFTLQIK